MPSFDTVPEIFGNGFYQQAVLQTCDSVYGAILADGIEPVADL
jgi:hypothetical protein